MSKLPDGTEEKAKELIDNAKKYEGKTVCMPESTMRTLVYFAFGVTPDEDDDMVIDKVIEKAYRDATNRNAFVNLLEESEKQKAKCAKEKASRCLKCRIKKYDKSENRRVFDAWHKESCLCLIGKYNDSQINGERFSYGNAQKWVNMTLKYLYLLGSIDVNIRKIRILDDSDYFHVPIDSYILDAFWEKSTIEEGFPVPAKAKKEPVRSKIYAQLSDHILPWSQWNEKNYTTFKEKCDAYFTYFKRIKPLVWESEAWIEQAKERNRTKKKKNEK